MSLSQIDRISLSADGLTVTAGGPITRADADAVEVHIFVLVVQEDAVARGVGVSTEDRWSAELRIERGTFGTGQVLASALSVTAVTDPPRTQTQIWSQSLTVTLGQTVSCQS
ncbi:hypothetical protein [Actinoplanes sp. GCM10030250]|uniref:hypothetical protein n=1 Tax=Actinoplanes sp. GCM10030250 TaxID=3273376 RepID=UPI0036087139